MALRIDWNFCYILCEFIWQMHSGIWRHSEKCRFGGWPVPWISSGWTTIIRASRAKIPKDAPTPIKSIHQTTRMTSRSPSPPRGRPRTRSPISEASRPESRSPSRPRRTISPRSTSRSPRRNGRYRSESRSGSRGRTPSPIRSTKVCLNYIRACDYNILTCKGCDWETHEECYGRPPARDLWNLWANSGFGYANEQAM